MQELEQHTCRLKFKPSGYTITVYSWENDGDNRSQKSIQGLTKEEVTMYYAIAQGFNHSSDYNNRICNLYKPTKEKINKVAEFMQGIYDRFTKEWKDKVHSEFHKDSIVDVLETLGLTSYEFYTRVTDSIEVEYSPVAITSIDATRQIKEIVNAK